MNQEVAIRVLLLVVIALGIAIYACWLFIENLRKRIIAIEDRIGTEDDDLDEELEFAIDNND